MLWRTIGCRRSRPESGSSAPRPSTGGVVKGPVSGVVEMGSEEARRRRCRQVPMWQGLSRASGS
jgi:hypothetical protein